MDNADLNTFQATKIWSDLIDAFVRFMPLKKHRILLKAYENSFTSEDAIAWFKFHIKTSKLHVPKRPERHQIIRLLDLFLQSNIFYDVINEKEKHFKQNGGLYRFRSDSSARFCNPKTGLREANSLNSLAFSYNDISNILYHEAKHEAVKLLVTNIFGSKSINFNFNNVVENIENPFVVDLSHGDFPFWIAENFRKIFSNSNDCDVNLIRATMDSIVSLNCILPLYISEAILDVYERLNENNTLESTAKWLNDLMEDAFENKTEPSNSATTDIKSRDTKKNALLSHIQLLLFVISKKDLENLCVILTVAKRIISNYSHFILSNNTKTSNSEFVVASICKSILPLSNGCRHQLSEYLIENVVNISSNRDIILNEINSIQGHLHKQKLNEGVWIQNQFIQNKDDTKSIQNAALTQLLDAILESTTISYKDKLKKLQHFQRCHPEVFNEKLPEFFTPKSQKSVKRSCSSIKKRLKFFK